MIIKSFELQKIKSSHSSIILIYGFDKTQQRINAIIDC